MSAWYVLNTLGIYQLAPGSPEFLVGRPMVDKAKIKVNQGWFEIEVTNNSKENKYVKEVKLNGKILQNSKFLFSEISAGSKLEIEMTGKAKAQ